MDNASSNRFYLQLRFMTSQTYLTSRVKQFLKDIFCNTFYEGRLLQPSPWVFYGKRHIPLILQQCITRGVFFFLLTQKRPSAFVWRHSDTVTCNVLSAPLKVWKHRYTLTIYTKNRQKRILLKVVGIFGKISTQILTAYEGEWWKTIVFTWN